MVKVRLFRSLGFAISPCFHIYILADKAETLEASETAVTEPVDELSFVDPVDILPLIKAEYLNNLVNDLIISSHIYTYVYIISNNRHLQTGKNARKLWKRYKNA